MQAAALHWGAASAMLLDVVTPDGYYTQVPAHAVQEFCDSIGIAPGSNAQDNFLRAVDPRVPEALQYRVSRGYRRPSNAQVLQKLQHTLEPDAERELKFVTGDGAVSHGFPDQYFREVVEQTEDMKQLNKSEFGRLLNGTLKMNKTTRERPRHLKGWTVVEMTDEEKKSYWRAHRRFRPFAPSTATTAGDSAQDGPGPEPGCSTHQACDDVDFVIGSVLDRLVLEVEVANTRFKLDTARVRHAGEMLRGERLQRELSEMMAEVAQSAENVEAARCLVGAKAGGNWLDAQTKVHRQLTEVRRESEGRISALAGKLRVAEDKLSNIEAVGIGERSIEKGIVLRDALRTADGAWSHRLELEAPIPSEQDLAQSHARTLVTHLEKLLFACGVGDVGRTRLLLAALLERPAVRRLVAASGCCHQAATPMQPCS
jgi:hypothetical protein